MIDSPLIRFTSRRRARAAGLAVFAGLVLAAGLPGSEPADAAARGLAIAREAKRRDTGYGDFSTTVEMILRNPAGQETRRTLTIRTLEPAAGNERSLIVFRDPPDVAGTTLLSHSLSDRPDDQWLFLPSLKRVRRIAAGNQSGSFVGSEFSYEDIAPQQVEKYTYAYLRHETLAGQECFVVARMPTNPKSGYNRQLFWVDTAEYRPLKVENYDRKDALAKTLVVEGYARYLDRYWRPARMVMTNHLSRKSTELLFRDYRFRAGASAADFEPASLGR
jgi:outer membrane lipoprotein-sorting protein